jgi:nuclear GTP-binding protein
MTKKNISNRKAAFKDINKKKIAAKVSKMTGKQGSSIRKSKASSNPNRPDPSGGKKGSMFRTKATINRLNMYNEKPDKKKMKQTPTDP